MQLRDYQENSLAALWYWFINNKTGNPLNILPCGAGKSVILSEFVRRVMQYPNQRVIVAAHVKELVLQNHEKLKALWSDAPSGIYCASAKMKQHGFPITYGSIQSMCRNPYLFGDINILIIDEVHLLSPKHNGMYTMFIKALKEVNPEMRIVGYTGSPYRMKGGHLLDCSLFTDVAYELEIKELLDRKFLTPLISKSSIIQANLTDVKITAGEFNLRDMNNILDDEELTNKAIDEVELLTSDRNHFLFFCAGIEHSEHVRDNLRARGWLADIITCKTPPDEREFLLKQFKESKEKRALVNNAVLTTGTDLPNIDCLVLLRGTASPVLYLQILGRGMRLHPEKENCILEGQRVLTNMGLIPIEKVTIDMKVWDGIDFVNHDGIVLRGEDDIIEYAGLKATKDHKVWTKDGWKKFEICALEQIPIQVTGDGGIPINYSDGKFRECIQGDSKKQRTPLHANNLYGVRESRKEGVWQSKEKSRWLPNVRTQAQFRQASPGRSWVVIESMHIRKTEMHKSKRQAVSRLWRKGSAIQLQKPKRNGASYNRQIGIKQVVTNRQNKQQRALRGWKYPTNKASCQYEQSACKPRNENDAFIQNRASGNSIRRQYINRIFWKKKNDIRRCNRSVSQPTIIQTKGRVWDILNAGQRNRFTCEGLLVSNCLVLDYAGNIERFGAVDLLKFPRNSSKKSKKEKLAPPQKICPGCREPLLIAVKVCTCGFIFESDNPTHDTHASNLSIMSSEIQQDIITEHEVYGVTYNAHTGKSGVPTLKVTYFDILNYPIASQYICFEHEGYARLLAKAWWKERIIKDYDPPKTISEILKLIEEDGGLLFKEPVKIGTKKNGKYNQYYELEVMEWKLTTLKNKNYSNQLNDCADLLKI